MIRRLLLTASLLVLASDLSAMPPLAEEQAPPPLLMSATARAPQPPAVIIGPKSDGTFTGDERALKTAVANAASPEAARFASQALARFYAQHELHVEALATMKEITPPIDDDAAKLFTAGLEYRVGRYEDALAALSDERLQSLGEARALRGMTLARFGAYEAAKISLVCGDTPPAVRAECDLLTAETMLATGDAVSAEQSLRAAQREASGNLAAEAAYTAALLNQAKGADAARQFRAIARGDAEPFASLAALQLVLSANAEGRIDESTALAEIHSIALRWSGGAFEREMLAAQARLSTAVDAQEAFAARRALAADHARSDAGMKARSELTGMLATLLDRTDLSPGAAAKLFYENIDYAPPGREGDLLIRRVAGELAELDLVSDAAELLEHQVFNRLRGTERSEVAADLAELYLEDRRPSEALRVIRATRIAGLDPETNTRRKLLEATALERTGALDAALQTLADADGADALRLRADIYWGQKSWIEAAAAYRALVLAAPAPLDATARASALRAAAAFLKAGADTDFAAFKDATADRLAGTREGEILNSLIGGASTANFLNAYRELYASSDS